MSGSVHSAKGLASPDFAFATQEAKSTASEGYRQQRFSEAEAAFERQKQKWLSSQITLAPPQIKAELKDEDGKRKVKYDTKVKR